MNFIQRIKKQFHFDRFFKKAQKDLKRADSAIRSVVEDIAETSHSTFAQANDTIGDLAKKARQIAKDNASGKYLTVTLLSRDDTIIASRGDMVTYEILNKAEEAGKLDQVFRNLSKEPLSPPSRSQSPEKITNPESES